MKRPLKAALISGLVFPGAGQLWLKYYFRGIALIVVVSACVAVIVQKAGQQAFAILEKMESEGGTVDMIAMLKSAGEAPEDLLTRSASALLVLCWVVGMVDAYIMGKKKDLADQSKHRGESRLDQN